jgi:hypothetical protein
MPPIIEYLTNNGKVWACPCGKIHSSRMGRCKYCHFKYDGVKSNVKTCPTCHNNMEFREDGNWYCSCGTKTLF